MLICQGFFFNPRRFHDFLAKKRKKDFVGYLQVSSLDRYKAAEQAYANVSTFLKYYRVISNRSQELVRTFCIVKNKNSDQYYEVPVKSKGYRFTTVSKSGGLIKP